MPVDLSDYVEVSERIALFREQYPEGSLQAEVIRWPEDGFAGIAVKAYAYREADDERPGVGHAFEPVPGTTPYTKNSELQNAETSAWGRAIVAALAADTKRGVASANEIRNRASAPPKNGADQPAVDTDPAGSVSPDLSPGSPGEVATAEGNGETAPAASPGHHFTVRAEVCTHKNNRGQPAPLVRIDGKDLCGMCGTPSLYIKETAS